MLLKQSMLLVCLVLSLLDVSETAKSKKVTAKKGKAQAKVELVEAKRLAPYVPKPDLQFWSPGGRLWKWDENLHDPLKNKEWQELFKELNDVLEANGRLEVAPEYYLILQSWMDYGMRITYQAESSFTSTLYMAHTHSEYGRNIPPIMGSQCTLQDCCDPLMSADWESQIQIDDLLNINQPSELERMFDEFATRVESQYHTFSPEDVKATICKEVHIKPTKSTVRKKITSVEEKYGDFLVSPGLNGKVKAINNIKKLHTATTGKLLLNLIESICKDQTPQPSVLV